MSSMPKVLIFVRCPCCRRWVYLGKLETQSIWDELADGFDTPFEIDYRAGGGRGKGWKSRVRRKRLPNSMKEAYEGFVRQIRNAQISLGQVE